jgi:hypothetical protein
VTTWKQDEYEPIRRGPVVTGQVLPPEGPGGTSTISPDPGHFLRYGSSAVLRGILSLLKLVRLALFFVLRTLRPVVRIVLGLLAGLLLLGSLISFAAAWYQHWPTNLLWFGGSFFVISVVCSALLRYYDMLLLRLTPEGVDLVLFN